MDEILQKSEDWHQLRCGKWTGSKFHDVLAKKKDGKPTQKREDLIWDIATERIQGYQPSGMTSYSLKWGNDNEPLARQSYEIKTGEFVEEIAFIKHPKYDFVGVSPDGLIGSEGMIEIKSPSSPKVHLQRWIDGVPDEYVAQLQGGLWVTGRKWIDFISYDGDTDDRFKLLVIRVYRDEAFINNLEDEILKAELEVQALIVELMKKVA
ncbi:MAG: exonuclease [Methylotenera sp.]|nr:MAG: exonuclease [Methylotenera sp.]